MKLLKLCYILILCGIVCVNDSYAQTEINSCAELRVADFQRVVNGKQTSLYFLKKGEITAAITNHGGRIVALCAPDKAGNLADVVLGFSTIDSYLNARESFHGALIGRVGNRIAKGKFTIDGKEYLLPLNNGENHLHGGHGGFHNVVWDVEAVTDSSVTLTYLSKDGEMGYPGNLNVSVQYHVTSKNELVIIYEATTDKSTPLNLTNHAFFNLAGEGNGTINNHVLTIHADAYTPVDAKLIPLAGNEPVEGTCFDFRHGKAIGADLPKQAETVQLKNGKGYDHNFVLNKPAPGQMTLAATVVEPVSGRKMEVFTREPGLQFYGGNFMNGKDKGKSGKVYKYRESFALETQHFPDSPNNKNFPSIILKPGQVYNTQSIYRFGIVR